MFPNQAIALNCAKIDKERYEENNGTIYSFLHCLVTLQRTLKLKSAQFLIGTVTTLFCMFLNKNFKILADLYCSYVFVGTGM